VSGPPRDPTHDEIAELRAQLEQLKIRVSNTEHAARNLTDSLDGIETQLLVALDSAAAETLDEPPAPAAAPPPKPEQLDLDTLGDWVDANLGRWAQRKLARHPGQAGFVWCAHWREHPESITVLWALRLAWLERVRQPDAAMIEYFLHYFYPALSALCDPLGPFHACAGAHHTDSPSLLSQENRNSP
jgi:hypothetical protein